VDSRLLRENVQAIGLKVAGKVEGISVLQGSNVEVQLCHFADLTNLRNTA
jgi:hypothetical protein